MEFSTKEFEQFVPTLQLRKRNREDLYQTTICQKCNEKEESFEHLTACEVDEARWIEKEYSIANQIWSNLDTVVRKRMTIEDLYTSLTGRKEADRYKKRNYMARGLIESDLAISLLAMGITRKVTDSIITEWWDKWHSFFQEEIWLQRCNEVAKWEKQMEINSKKKKTKKVSSERKRKKNNNSVGKVIDKGGGEDLREGFEDGPRRPKSEDKRCDRFKEKMVLVTEEMEKWIWTGRWSRWNKN